MAVFETTKSGMTSNCIYFNWYKNLFDNNSSDDIKRYGIMIRDLLERMFNK